MFVDKDEKDAFASAFQTRVDGIKHQLERSATVVEDDISALIKNCAQLLEETFLKPSTKAKAAATKNKKGGESDDDDDFGGCSSKQAQFRQRRGGGKSTPKNQACCTGDGF